MKKIFLSIVCFFILLFHSVLSVYATTAADVQKEQEQTQEALDQVSERMDDIEEQKAVVSEEIVVLDTELVDILTSISICEDEIAAKEDEIRIVKEELQQAEDDKIFQYENMKTRIRFMYEKGDSAYLAIFLEAGSYSEMLNKASYVEELYSYDRELLNQYQETVRLIGEYKEDLEIEEADLLTSKHELQEQQDYLQTILATKRATVANFETELAQASKQAQNLKTQLQEQTEQIKKLQRAEELARKEKEKKEAAEKAAAQTVAGYNAESKVVTTSVDDVVTSVNTSSEGTELGRQLAAYGCQFIGNPYVYGGTSLTNGTDCSGFTQGVYAHFGIKIPRDSTSQRFAGVGVDLASAQPGDLVCYAGHVGLYIGNGQIVHASSERTGIKISPATYRTILAVRRIVS